MVSIGVRKDSILISLTPIVMLALALSAWSAATGVAAAGPLFVSPSGNDANGCQTFATACRTIGAAVGKASTGDTIVIASGIYTEVIGIDKDVTLIGFGSDATIINQGRIAVSNATVRIFDLAITNGYNAETGGALFNDMGNVTLEYVSILSSHADSGGGIYNYKGTLSIDHTTVAGNSTVHDGGGVFNEDGTVSISHSTILSNTACNTNCLYLPSGDSGVSGPLNGFISYGGGIVNDLGSLTIDSSTIISNSAVNGGDGINNFGSMAITNSTVSGNGSSGLRNFSTLTLTNVTINNHVLEGLRSTGITRVKNTIIANTTGGSNCTDSGIVSLGHNLSSDNSCVLTGTGDLTNTNPLLGPLQDNGGPTPTHALLAGSPAINHGDNAGCPATDQRGIPRPQAGLCDIGAYEYVFPFTMILPVIRR